MKVKAILSIMVFSLIAFQAQVIIAAPLGTAFTYQGRLIDNNRSADGLYDFQFKLFDDPCTGSQIGGDVNEPDVDVIDGYFTVELDFGGSVFDGNACWLEIGVRPGEQSDPCAYSILQPRQEITPTPYALYAETSGSVSWGEILDRPVGLDDGDDVGITSETDPQVGYNTTNYIPKWDGSALVKGQIYDNGNIGIGITEPNALLHLRNYYGNQLKLGSSNQPSKEWSLSADLVAGFAIVNENSGSELTALYIERPGNVGIGTTIPTARLHVNEPDTDDPLNVSVSGVTKLIVKNNGDVGIGTMSPGNNLKLDVAGRIAPEWGTTTDASYRFGDGSENTGFASPSSDAIAVIINGSQKMYITDPYGYVGIGDTSPTYRLELPNNADESGRGRANAWSTYSSRRLKKNIKPIENALDKVKRLRGVYFDWKKDGIHDIGMVAEEVGEVIPEVVDYEANGVDAASLSYGRLVALLIEAVKEQQCKIAELEATIAQGESVEQRLEALERMIQQQKFGNAKEVQQ